MNNFQENLKFVAFRRHFVESATNMLSQLALRNNLEICYVRCTSTLLQYSTSKLLLYSKVLELGYLLITVINNQKNNLMPARKKNRRKILPKLKKKIPKYFRPHRSKPTKFILAIKYRNTPKILLINVNRERLGVQINIPNGVPRQ